MKAKTALLLCRTYCFIGFIGNLSAALFFGYFYKEANPEITKGISTAIQDSQVFADVPYLWFAVYAGFMALLNLVLMVAPKRPFWWWANFFNLVLGVGGTGGCCLLSLAALIGWVGEPLRKEFFKNKRKSGKSTKKKKKS